jgi:hypothetical protein
MRTSGAFALDVQITIDGNPAIAGRLEEELRKQVEGIDTEPHQGFCD